MSAQKERTLIDLIYFNRPVGGIKTASEILRRFVSEKKCDIKKLIEYTIKFSGVKTKKVIGFNLEQAGVSDNMLKPLEKSVKNTSLISLTDSRKGSINKRWKIITNPSTNAQDSV